MPASIGGHMMQRALLALVLAHAALFTGAAGACSMTNPGVREKYEKFTQHQLTLRASRQRKESLDMMQGERVRQMVSQSQPTAIRVKLIVQLEGTFLPPDEATRLREQLAPGAVNIIQKFVQVRVPSRFSIRMAKPISKDDAFCNDAYASELWTDGGIQNHDLVLYVTANQTKDCKEGALAYTLPCLTDPVTLRPIAAGMNVCPLSLKSSPRKLLNTLVHECVHALGFSGALFPLYYDSRTWNPYQKDEQIAVELAPKNNTKAQAMFIAFPAMKDLARKYFGCESLPGTPADVGSSASHFKQRLLGHELMMPATSEDGATKQITEFTLTMLESTGWYKTRMDHAQPATFGKGGGCDLAMETCGTYMKKNPWQNDYCPANKLNADQCTFDYKGIGVCEQGMDDGCLLAGGSKLRGNTLTCQSASTWSTLRHQAFYFHHKMFGGTVGSPATRCYAVQDETPACKAADDGGPSPTCLMRQAMCLETRCSSTGAVEALFRFSSGDTIMVPCPQGGHIDLVKQLPGRGFTSGKLKCPLASIICPELSCKRPCNRGVCSEGRCICDMEYTGDNCEIPLVQGLT